MTTEGQRGSVLATASIRTLLEVCQPGDAVYLDLDDTLISTEPGATEAWAVDFSAALVAEGVPKGPAWEAACHLWTGLQRHCEVQAVEGAATVATLQTLRERGLELVGLTARSPEAADETAAQLSACQLAPLLGRESLGALAPPDAPTTAQDKGVVYPVVAGRPPLTHDRGVVYCTGSRKPQGLRSYEAARRTAHGSSSVGSSGVGSGGSSGAGSRGRVVLVDDKLAHLLAVKDEVERQGRLAARIPNLSATCDGVHLLLPRRACAPTAGAFWVSTTLRPLARRPTASRATRRC